MSQQEVDRLSVIQLVAQKQLRQADAAEQLGLSVRQVKRLLQRYRQQGAAGLVSGRRGKRANNAISTAIRQTIMALVHKHYADFGPTFACEKLGTHSGIPVVSVETLRQWMIADGLWQPKQRKRARIHQHRPRRPCLGELVQIDGSPHAWFEGRGDYCTLIVFIDDATSRLLALRFVPAETTQAYMETLDGYLHQHGRPVAFYSDKHSIFRVNHPEHDGELTQFSRALKTLDIEAIHANTPQAKGRVERANQTLQDRLVKELRLQGINDIDTANAFLPTFIDDYNQRFAVEPQSPTNAHRPLLHSKQALALILCQQTTRKLSKNLTCQYHNRLYQIQAQGASYALRGAIITVCNAYDGKITLLYKGKRLRYRLLATGEPPIPLDDEKSLHLTVQHAKAKQAENPTYKPAPDHPWKRSIKQAVRNAQRQ